MANTTQKVKDYEAAAREAVDEQAILDKYNAATAAQYAAQREQNRQAENQFYNQMYNTQQTAMDTIRQSNAAAVSTGASRGVQAAQELSALLGLQQESVASATEVAAAQRATAQEETAAVLDNVLKAYTQAQQERANLVQTMMQQDSINQQQETDLYSLWLQARANNDTVAMADIEQRLTNLGLTPVANTARTEAASRTSRLEELSQMHAAESSASKKAEYENEMRTLIQDEIDYQVYLNPKKASDAIWKAVTWGNLINKYVHHN
jgi:hypothetical protein